MFIILDRDGVINEDSDEYIKTPDEWVPIPGSLKAIADLNRAGHSVVIATNQSGLARGLYTEYDLQQIHKKMQKLLAEEGGHIEAIFYCPHHPDDQCDCRKPKPGLLLQIAEKFHINLTDALMVGDAARDIAAAKAAHCPAVLVKTGKGMRTITKPGFSSDVPVYDNLAAVVAVLLSNEKL